MVDKRRVAAQQHPSSGRHAIFPFLFFPEYTEPRTPRSKSETTTGIHLYLRIYVVNRRPSQYSIVPSFVVSQPSPRPATERLQTSPTSLISGIRCNLHVPPRSLMSSTPTTRSRTLLFLSYRDSRTSSSTSHHRYAPDNDGDESERLIDPAKDHIALDVGLPPKWSAHPQR